MQSRLFDHELFQGKTQKRVGYPCFSSSSLSFFEPQSDKLVANKQAHTNSHQNSKDN